MLRKIALVSAAAFGISLLGASPASAACTGSLSCIPDDTSMNCGNYTTGPAGKPGVLHIYDCFIRFPK